jgi:hypothetical protein
MCSNHRIFYGISSCQLDNHLALLKEQVHPLIGLNLLLCQQDFGSVQLLEKLVHCPAPFIASLPATVLPNIINEDCHYLFALCTLQGYQQAAEILLPVLADEQPENGMMARIDGFFAQQGHVVSMPLVNPALGSWRDHTVELRFFEDNQTPEQNIVEIKSAIQSLREANRYPKSTSTSTEYEWELQKWKQRTRLYQEFLELSKAVQQQEYFEVVDWYQKEYEALPRWYKKFGQVIKTIQGKRSIASFFPSGMKRKRN